MIPVELPTVDRETVEEFVDQAKRGVARALAAGPTHRRRLSNIDVRIVVSGVRGKSATTRWLHEIFNQRGYDTFAKITGNHPTVLHNDDTHDINRDTQVRLYENEAELARFDDLDVAIFENQGIRHYTTRLVNSQFVDPDVVFLTNIREDHLDTLGRDRTQIARSLARAVPRSTPVVCGEQDAHLQRYIRAELARREAPVTFVSIPSDEQLTPAAECVYGLNDVLAAVGEPPLPEQELTDRLETMRPAWRLLPNGRIHNAASVNDVQSTELVRRSLVGSTGTVVEPFMYLRRDRRGRTASFVDYLDSLSEEGAIERVHLGGPHQTLFETNASVPVVRHETEAESAEAVLDDLLEAGRPAMLMGNTVTEFMRSLVELIEERTIETVPGETWADRTRRHTGVRTDD
jgi:hypothetical protein